MKDIIKFKDTHADMIEEIKFICDPSLGRLTKWLRVFGIDTVCCKEIKDVAEFLIQLPVTKRIFLTTNKKIMSRKYWNNKTWYK